MAYEWGGVVNPPAPAGPPVSKTTTTYTGPTNSWVRYAQSAVGATAKLYAAAGKNVFNFGKKEVNDLAIQPSKDVSAVFRQPAGTGKNASDISRLQQNAQRAALQGKVSQQTLRLIRGAPATARIQALRMVGSSKDADIQSFLKKQTTSETGTKLRRTGAALSLASLTAGGGEVAEAERIAAKQGFRAGLRVLVKGIAKEAPAGAVGGAGGQLESKPFSKAGELATGAAGGAATAGVFHIGGKVGSRVLTKGEQAAEEATAREAGKVVKRIPVKDLGETKLLSSGEGKSTVEGKGFTMSSKVNQSAIDRNVEINRLQKRITKFQQGKLNITPEQAKAEQLRLQSLKSSGAAPKKSLAKTIASTPKKIEAAARVEAPTIEAKMGKPHVEKPQEPLVNTNKPVNSIVDKLTPKALKGKLNPVDAAARGGHTDFATAAREIAGNKIYALRRGNNVASTFEKLYANYKVKGGTDQAFIKDIESGKLGSKAHELWSSINSKTGQQLANHGIIKGSRENYVARVGQFTEKGYRKGGGGLTKSGSFSKARQQLADEFGFTSDKFKTHEEYKSFVEQNGGKVLSNPTDILRHTLPSKLEAIENAKGLERLDKTAMADNRPATVGFSPAKGVPRQFSDYATDLIPGRAVHPDAVQTIKSLVHTYSPDEINNPVAKANSVAKRLITLNGLIHAKNFGLASLRKQGAIHTATALLKYRKDLGKTFGEENIRRAITKGGMVPFEQSKQDLFDKLGNPTNVKTWNKVASLPGKAQGAINEELFNKLGNHLAFSTYFNTEKQMVKAGLSEDEAARVAGQAARNVSFISAPVESSVEYRKTARFVLFAGQYFKSTLNEAARAIGVSRDMSLSRAAQRQAQKNAIVGIARGMTYLLALAQGINYATTGHSTFQNKDSKISPVFYVDKKTGKEYHITNWYGQLGDMMHLVGNPIKELSNKVSPLAQEGSRLYQAITSGQPDPYTGQTIIDRNAPGWRQTSQAIGNFMENMVSPFGFQISPNQKSNPGMVTFAKMLGYGASTVDQNAMEKDVLSQYYATLPAGANKTPPAMSQLEAMARNDLAHGQTNTANLQQLKSQMSEKAYAAFVKTGGESQVQRAFDKLPEDQRLQLIEKYSPDQLKELDLTSVGKSLVDSSAKATIQSLRDKGFNDQRVAKDLQKAGLSGQLTKIKAEAKRQAAVSNAKARHAKKFVNPFVR